LLIAAGSGDMDKLVALVVDRYIDVDTSNWVSVTAVWYENLGDKKSLLECAW